MFDIVVDADVAKRVLEYFLELPPGIQVWNSVNLSNPGAQWITPITNERPSWQAGQDPVTITDPDRVGVQAYKEVKRFHVATRMGSQGLTVKVTDGGTRRIRSAVAKAGEGARYEFDYYDYNNAVILAPDGPAYKLSEFLPEVK